VYSINKIPKVKYTIQLPASNPLATDQPKITKHLSHNKNNNNPTTKSTKKSTKKKLPTPKTE
jgi:hypothetical protein